MIESDAVASHQKDGALDASVLVQNAGESAEHLLERVEQNARVLGDAGYWIRSIRLVLGADDAVRHADRVDLVCRLGRLLTADSSLHLVATNVPGRQVNWFELVGMLLADSRWPLKLKLVFHDHPAPDATYSLRPRLEQPGLPQHRAQVEHRS